MFLNKIRNIFCVPDTKFDTKFVSATNVAHAGKRGNICVGNNVSATMCSRLPGPLLSTILLKFENATLTGHFSLCLRKTRVGKNHKICLDVGVFEKLRFRGG